MSAVLFVSALSGHGGPVASLASVLRRISEIDRIVVAPASDVGPGGLNDCADMRVVIQRPRGLVPILQAQLRVIRLVRFSSPRPGVIHANGLTELTVVWPAAFLGRTPVVIWSHNSQLPRLARLLRPLLRSSLVDIRWLAVSRFAADQLVEWRLTDRGRITIVPNPIGDEVRPIRRASRVPGAPIRVAYLAGSDRQIKGFQFLPEAIQLTAGLGCIWDIYSSPPFSTNHDAWTRLMSLEAGTFRVHERVANISDALAQADIVFVPSTLESFGRVVAEAMRSSLPVVASDLPPIREMLGESEAGLLFPVGNIAAAARLIEQLIDDEDLRGVLGGEGERRSQAFDPDSVVSQLMDQYRDDGSKAPDPIRRQRHDPKPPPLSTALAAGLRTVSRLAGRWGEPATGWVAGRLPQSWLPPHEGRVSVTRSGTRWHLDLADNLQWRLYTLGSYEAATLRAAMSQLDIGSTVIDVGANIGVFTLPVARFVGATGRVIAIEPAPDTLQLFREHLAINGMVDRVEVLPNGLGSSAGSGVLRSSTEWHPADLGTRTLHGTGPVVAEIEIVTGDALVEQLGLDRIDLLKIDVEGSEVDVLQGFSETLGARVPRSVILESAPGAQVRSNHDPQVIFDLMRHYGYCGYEIHARGLRPVRGVGNVSSNVFFLRGEPWRSH